MRFLGPEDSHVVVASNSPCLKVFELQTSACQILHGHTGEPPALCHVAPLPPPTHQPDSPHPQTSSWPWMCSGRGGSLPAVPR